MSNVSKATLSAEDRRTFFRLFIPLLQFTNQKYEINEYLDEDLRSGHPYIEDLKEVADVLWQNTDTIDEFIKANEDRLSAVERALLERWRHPVSGQFILERHLAKGSIFIESKEGNVYLVKGLTDPWSVMFANRMPPILLDTTLIPFRDCIISDGLTMVQNIYFSTGARNDFKDVYMYAKQNDKIITSL